MSNITTTVGTICADLPPPSALFIDAKASAALALMQKSNFSSVVVLDKEQVCVGVLSLVDFVNYASQAGYFATDRPQVSKRSGKDSPQRLREESDETWLSQTLSEVLGKDSESTSIAVLQPTDRVSSTYGILGGGHHRCLVQSKEWLRLLSQTDIGAHVSALFEEGHAEVEQWRDTTVDEVLAEQPKGNAFFSLKPTDLALFGFQKMAVLKTRTLPVLDANGQCVATLSSSNLRGLSVDTYNALLLPVIDFLKASNAANASSTVDKTEEKLSTGVTTTVGARLSEVLTQLQAYKVHRVWVTDEHGRVINAISYTDIFHFLASWHQ